MAVTRTRNKRGQGDQLRADITAAARAVVEASGAESPLTLRGVAREAGITAPSIYAHFADAGELADAVLADGFIELDAAVASAIETETSPDARLLDAALAYITFAWTHRGLYRFMVGGGGFAPDSIVTFERVSRELQACVDAGLSASVDPHSDAFLVWVGIHGMSTLQKPDRPELRRLGALDRPALAAELVRRLAKLAG